jgi:hypothetical protein
MRFGDPLRAALDETVPRFVAEQVTSAEHPRDVLPARAQFPQRKTD